MAPELYLSERELSGLEGGERRLQIGGRGGGGGRRAQRRGKLTADGLTLADGVADVSVVVAVLVLAATVTIPTRVPGLRRRRHRKIQKLVRAGVDRWHHQP